ncbi:MAG: ATP-binding protein [Euryarchaeota archaeon]|nr:ATP-binding protein [Euryarchaeota archaeon]
MAEARTTAAELVAQKLRPQRPGEILKEAVRRRHDEARKKGLSEEDALQSLFPTTILDATTLKRIAAAVLSGSNLLFLGPPGSGKTTLAKDIWDLYPKEVLAVEDCPVQDDPFSLVDTAFYHEVPACPYCKARHGGVTAKTLGEFEPSKVDAHKVPAGRRRLREGYGLSRIQGSPEVFPDNLTGAINIAKLEEIGDPSSPLVMEPGKVLQANRGLLLIDEIGKLPRGTQNVLLQALQENVVSPAKSRETFPASFVAIATSNLQDLDNVTEPLIGRLAIVYVDFNEGHAKNATIVRRGIAATRPFTPDAFIEAAATLMQSWRRTAGGTDELGEVGSNRTMIDIVRRAQAFALLAAKDVVEAEDFHQGAKDAMVGRIRARGQEGFDQNRTVVENFVEKKWRDAVKDGVVRSWCRFFVGELKEDKAEALRIVDSVKNKVEGRGGDATKYERFRRFIESHERLDGLAADEATKRIFQLYESTGAFTEKPITP